MNSQITPTGIKKKKQQQQQQNPQSNIYMHPNGLRRMKISCIKINDDKTTKLFKQSNGY